jgi:ABC-2 type transport system ATP-binding protein
MKNSPRPLIHLDHVTKEGLTERPAIEDCSLTFTAGNVYGIVGRQGAGKSALVRLMLGIYLPTSGSCSVCGETPPLLSDALLNRIGYVHQDDELVSYQTGEEFLRFIRPHYAHWNNDFLQSLINKLDVPLTTPIKRLSPSRAIQPRHSSRPRPRTRHRPPR